VASPANQVLVSAASAWEIAIKHALGRLTFPVDGFEEILQRMGFDALPIGLGHAIAAGRLPRHHDDPFDRLLVAQAQTEGLTLVSTDGAVARYDVPVLGAET
jgi:PIN domain nuclease of toxin-antitoxin system